MTRDSRHAAQGRADYERLPSWEKQELGDALVCGTFDVHDWYNDMPHPERLRAFKNAWNAENEN